MALDYERLWRKNPKLKSFTLNKDGVVINKITLPKDFDVCYYLYMFSIIAEQRGMVHGFSYPPKQKILTPKEVLRRSFKMLVTADKIKPFLFSADLKHKELYKILFMLLPFFEELNYKEISEHCRPD